MGTEISTLGQLNIQHNGQERVEFISMKASLLFVYLAMHPGEHTRKKLAAMFWSETNDKQALKNLRTVLSSIRQQLPDALVITRDGLAVNPSAAIQVDASLFEAGCQAVFTAPDEPDRLPDMQNLAELYRGAFLVDVAFREAVALDEWLMDKQRELQELYTRLLYEITEQAQQQADYETGIQYARRLVSLDPYWDAARCQLMRLLAYTNRSNEALQQYESFARLLVEELGAEPEEETRTLYEQIRSRHIRLPQQRVARSSIMLPDMPFVETLEDIALAQRMLNTPQCRLLTVYGISGIGKTALATQIAFHRQHLYADGAYLISLKQSQSARDLLYAVASSLGIDALSQSSPPELEQTLIEYLRDRHILLVLDNYEHLLPETGFVQKILEQTSRMQLVVTSQAPLNLFREWLLPLHGLRLPAPGDPNPEACEAVRLFELTAQRVNPRFDLMANLADVVEICQLVDGLPLALIIAAGWTQIVPITRIKEYIIEGQEFSLPLQQDLPPHHQSLEMMLEHTWNTLAEPEQYALTALSIFNAVFVIEEVEQICGVTLDVLAALIQKSLIQKYDDRYRIHQLIWRYARKKLLYSERKAALAQQYMDYMIQILRDIQQQKLPLHEYLLAIESWYATLWNYTWMPRSFQPVYMLTLSRSLMAYWEISRSDELNAIRKLFEAIAAEPLAPEMRLLLHTQLARFHLQSGQTHPAYQRVQQILQENATAAAWTDWGTVFTLYLLTARSPADDGQPVDADSAILLESYLKLLGLYLDMRDYGSADSFFEHLLDNTTQPMQTVLLQAIRATIFAETRQYPAAQQYFTQALAHSGLADMPLLYTVLQALALRLDAETE